LTWLISSLISEEMMWPFPLQAIKSCKPNIQTWTT
jgi:hypothetical protein